MNELVLAVDIGGTNTKLALVDREGCIGRVRSIPTDGKHGAEPYLKAVASAALDLLSDSALPYPCTGIGIGVAGFVDPAHSCMMFNPNLPWLEQVPLKSYFETAVSLPVVLEVDSNAAAQAEAFYGSGIGVRRLLVITIGTGLGGGMVIDGQLVRLSEECLGDIGHILVDPGGPSCAAGCRGCAEALVSAPALERYAEEFAVADQGSVMYGLLAKGTVLSTAQILTALNQGDSAAFLAVSKLAHYLGITLASMLPILLPDQVCLAGGVSEAGAVLLDRTMVSMLAVAGPVYAENVEVVKAHFGWQAGLLGAAAAFRCRLDGMCVMEPEDGLLYQSS